MKVHNPPSNFYNSVALTILELLAFNEQNIRGSRDSGHAPFRKILRGHVQTVPANMLVNFNSLTVMSVI